MSFSTMLIVRRWPPRRTSRIRFVPGGAFYFDGRGRNTMRLSFSLPNEETIAAGIARLAKLM